MNMYAKGKMPTLNISVYLEAQLKENFNKPVLWNMGKQKTKNVYLQMFAPNWVYHNMMYFNMKRHMVLRELTLFSK